MVGAIPFDTSQPSELFIPELEAFSRTEKQQSALCSGQQPMDVVERREIPNRTPLWRWWRARRR
jgi:isochorismate synthase